MSTALEVSGLTVNYGSAPVLQGLDLTLEAGRYGVVLGVSGAGKSSLLRAIAGLVPAEGVIRLGARTVQAKAAIVPPEERGVGMMFQGLALWPHMTAREHLDFALGATKLTREERRARREELLSALGIAALADRRPAALSGGERQRLALARALVARPTILLLDEPTSSLDPLRKAEVRSLLARVNERFGTTVLHVTHDQEEAFELGDCVYVLADGRVRQAGRPEDLCDQPTSLAVATFLRLGALLPGTVTAKGLADCALGRIPVFDSKVQGPAWLLIRPRALELVSEGGVPAVVRSSVWRGSEWRTECALGDDRLIYDGPERHPVGAVLRFVVRSKALVLEARAEP